MSIPRRYAILDDNQQLLEERLAELGRDLPSAIASRVCAACVIGSVAEGRARDASDIDVILVLREGSPTRSDYTWWDTEVAPAVIRSGRFPIQPVFIARTSLATDEPNLQRALTQGFPLWDPEGVFRGQS